MTDRPRGGVPRGGAPRGGSGGVPGPRPGASAPRAKSPRQPPFPRAGASGTGSPRPGTARSTTSGQSSSRPATPRPGTGRSPARTTSRTSAPPSQRGPAGPGPAQRAAKGGSADTPPRQRARAGTAKGAGPAKRTGPAKRNGPAKRTGPAKRNGPAKRGGPASGAPKRPAPRPGARRRPPTRVSRFTARVADPDRRILVAVATMLVVLAIFGGRLVQLQGVDSSALAAAALAERTRTVDLPAHRGDIRDVTGAVLATTVERRDITVDQTLVPLYTKRIDGQKVKVGVAGAAKDVAAILRKPEADIRKSLTGNKKFAYVAKNITPEVWRQVARLAVPGLVPKDANRRLYPNGAVAGNILGFVNSAGVPVDGVERAYGEQLAGTNGAISYEKSLDGTQIPTGVTSEVEPRNGETVTLTIDRDLQWKAQELITAQVAKTEAEGGYVVVQKPKTGEVLALASAPTMDPNKPTKDPPGNKALTDVFEPGSTSKVITAAAAIEEGKITPQTRMVVEDKIRRSGKTFNDSHSHEPEKMTFAGVLAESSNVGTIMAGEKLTNDQLHDYLTRFGFGTRTGVGLPETPGILAKASDWSGSQRFTVMFGQGVAVNALQATSVFSTIANDGVRVSPSIVKSTTDPDGVTHSSPKATETRVVSAETARQVREMLETVVGEDGTAKQATIPGYRVAGKTGTAQAPDGNKGYRGYTSSFIGMAPAEDPELVVSVVLQRPQKGHYGGDVAAPVFQQLMTYALAKQGVAPTGTTAPVVPLTYD